MRAVGSAGITYPGGSRQGALPPVTPEENGARHCRAGGQEAGAGGKLLPYELRPRRCPPHCSAFLSAAKDALRASIGVACVPQSEPPMYQQRPGPAVLIAVLSPHLKKAVGKEAGGV